MGAVLPRLRTVSRKRCPQEVPYDVSRGRRRDCQRNDDRHREDDADLPVRQGEKSAFHSLLAKIAQNKAIDRFRKDERYAAKLEKLAQKPIEISDDDWQRETFNMALRRVFADPTIRESSKIAFRRVVQQGEDVATVARDLGLEPNAIYQIRNRMKERLQEEVRKIQESLPDGL